MLRISCENISLLEYVLMQKYINMHVKYTQEILKNSLWQYFQETIIFLEFPPVISNFLFNISFLFNIYKI